MSVVYLNGDFVDESEANISINDAGYYFGDGIYEVILLYKGKLIDKDSHLSRLMSCFEKVYFKNYPSKEEILHNIDELLKRNPNVKTASIYMQFTRGDAVRSHRFLELDLKPNCLIKIIPCEIDEKLTKNWHCNVIDDPRRTRCDIKMISLLPMVLAKYESEKAGFDDVIFYNNKVKSITEGSSFNLFIVQNDNKIITCPLGNEILSGCTRARIIDIIKNNNFDIEERYFTKEELLNAREVFATGAIKLIVPIVKIDGKQIGNGKIGEITMQIFNKYIEFMNS